MKPAVEISETPIQLKGAGGPLERAHEILNQLPEGSYFILIAGTPKPTDNPNVEGLEMETVLHGRAASVHQMLSTELRYMERTLMERLSGEPADEPEELT